MEKKVSILIFKKNKEINLQEISRQYPDIVVKKKECFHPGWESVIILGSDNEVNEIKEELQAKEIILGGEEEEIVEHKITVFPGESRAEAREIIKKFHDSIVDMFEES